MSETEELIFWAAKSVARKSWHRTLLEIRRLLADERG